MEDKLSYIAIDLKSFYASVECIERGLNPLTANLVVADESRTQKTICLAVSPALKSYGIPGRPRLFEVIQKVNEANAQRKYLSPTGKLTGKSCLSTELNKNSSLAIDFIAAPPRMAHYINYSTQIYQIYLKYVAPQDIHVYSIDEVFMDATAYLKAYKMTAYELAATMIQDVLKTTGITATAGIGTNLYLCKIAMDIMAKHTASDKDGVRIAELDEVTYRKALWNHKPITDFWRVGKGYAKKLEEIGIHTMGDVAKCSVGKSTDFYNEDLLYKIFGINAELLIDHAWGYEPCTMAHIKSYKPSTNSISSGQVLHCPYSFEKARLIVQEMADLMALDLVYKRLVTDQIVLTLGYDIENISNNKIAYYNGDIKTDNYGRKVPKPAHGSISLGCKTSSARLIVKAVTELFDKISNNKLLIRRINISANHLINEANASNENTSIPEQLNLFTDYDKANNQSAAEKAQLNKERKIQEAVLDIKKKFGKNAVFKGIDLEDGATAIERNNQIGGHKA